MANSRKWNLEIIKTDEYKNSEYLANLGNRCFHCKNSLFKSIKKLNKDKESVILMVQLKTINKTIDLEKSANNHSSCSSSGCKLV